MKKTNKAKKIKNNIFTVAIIIGLILIIYPFISQIYYSALSKQSIKDFDNSAKKIEASEVKNRMMLADLYNKSLSNKPIEDPYMKKKLEQGRKEYARMLEIEEKIGYINIPSIDVEIPIYAGTSENILQKGVGHLEGTSLPIGGKNTHSVLTAHSGIPNNRLFTDLNKVKKGDKFYITNIKETIAYKVDNIKVVEPSEFQDLVIFDNHDYATLLTCTPYMVNSHRLLVRGTRVPYSKEDKDLEKSILGNGLLKIGVVTIIISTIIILATIKVKKKRKEMTRKS